MRATCCLLQRGSSLRAGRFHVDAGLGQRQRCLADLALRYHDWRHMVNEVGTKALHVSTKDLMGGDSNTGSAATVLQGRHHFHKADRV